MVIKAGKCVRVVLTPNEGRNAIMGYIRKKVKFEGGASGHVVQTQVAGETTVALELEGLETGDIELTGYQTYEDITKGM